MSSILVKNGLAIFTGVDKKTLVYHARVLSFAEWGNLADAIEYERDFHVKHDDFELLLLGGDMEVTDRKDRRVYINIKHADLKLIRQYAGIVSCALFCVRSPPKIEFAAPLSQDAHWSYTRICRLYRYWR